MRCLFLFVASATLEFAMVLGWSPSTVHAQELAPGSEIKVRPSRSWEMWHGARLQTEGRWTEAVLVRLGTDSLWYQAGGELRARAVSEVELQAPSRENRRWLGFAVGGLLGGIVGAAVGAAMSPGPEYATTYPDGMCPPYQFGCSSGPAQRVRIDSSTDDIVTAAAIGALVVGGIGWMIGKGMNKWAAVNLEAVTPGDVTFGMAVTIPR